MRGSRGAAQAAFLLVLILVVIVFVVVLLPPSASAPMPRRLASAPAQVLIERQADDSWRITEQYVLGKDTQRVIRSAGDEVPATDTALIEGLIAANNERGWTQTAVVDEQPVLERSYSLADEHVLLASVWTVDTAVDLASLSAYGVSIIPAQGSAARIDAPNRLLVATAPGGDCSDRLDGTRRCILSLEPADMRLVLRVAPGWARVPGGADVLHFLQGNPIGVLLAMAATLAGAYLLKKIGAWLWGRGRGGWSRLRASL